MYKNTIPILVASALSTATVAGYAEDRDTIVIRLVEHEATGTGSISEIPFTDLPTAATYTASPVENLVNKAVNHIDRIGKALLPVDEELDRFVDALVEQSYADDDARPLTRSV